ncbi:hypothetical protein [Clostridium grantii]|uniref:HPr Serine kinase C-terminal domain-containing protein n=1 Tax=Clostridium grantii DSM 8605 TaxID=1121316 RepID=A0A1M5X617_9CLOT|nr:hypothetical protein [Clostridium grantii]SHH95251.1 hypothetical protein SAMN02745207_03376 [Clostridium grantii DSM 8605]
MNLKDGNINVYNYKAYGLNIQSEIMLPELLLSDNNQYIDVNILYGVLPQEISKEIDNGKHFEFGKEKMWFCINNIAKYYISNGNTIIVEPFENANQHNVKAFLLGSAFGMLLIQRNTIAIHGGTIVIDGQALVITGNQGAGKSTLTSAFRDKGYSFMSDDVSVLGKRKDLTHIIYPGYPQQKLCRDAMEKMNYHLKDFKRIDEGRDKYAIPVHKNFIKHTVSLGAICEITIGEKEYVEIEEITGTEKLKLLLKNIYRVEVTQYTGINIDYMKNCIYIAKEIPFFKIKRPKDKFSVEDQITVIEKALIEKNNVIEMVQR